MDRAICSESRERRPHASSMRRGSCRRGRAGPPSHQGAAPESMANDYTSTPPSAGIVLLDRRCGRIIARGFGVGIPDEEGGLG